MKDIHIISQQNILRSIKKEIYTTNPKEKVIYEWPVSGEFLSLSLQQGEGGKKTLGKRKREKLIFFFFQFHPSSPFGHITANAEVPCIVSQRSSLSRKAKPKL